MSDVDEIDLLAVLIYDRETRERLLSLTAERDALAAENKRLKLAEAVASAASLYMVTLEAEDDGLWDAEDDLREALKPWREARAALSESKP